jgi:hypothetical protein
VAITKRHSKFIALVVILTTFLSCFFYAHEFLPKPIRAATALIETPVAIASGLSHYLNLGVAVYETPWSVILSNLLFSIALPFFINNFFITEK